MSFIDRMTVAAASFGRFLISEPREANTEGGIYPALFGTVLMVLLMSLAVMPLGVLTAVYMTEYARPGLPLTIAHHAVNNLAGIPSIVIGIFGLTFFVYGIGGGIDELLFADGLPAPTFGTGGILWASLTLALLTVPVVVVATREGLLAVPPGWREGSLALGATRWQTLRRIVLPAAMPGILTGLILAVGRAVGEVAPLMLTGAVKLAPSLPVDAAPPFIHLERKFMHLGFHIFDVSMQSPNVEAAKPMAFAATLVLLLLVVVINLTAIVIRRRLRTAYRLVEI
jgi:phosphate transport system permease protein